MAVSEEEMFVHIRANLSQVLLAAQNPQNPDYGAANTQYKSWEKNCFPVYVTALAFELADKSKGESDSRQLAGLLLYRTLHSDDEATLSQIKANWLHIKGSARDYIKKNLIELMELPETKYRHMAATCIAQIAILEIPAWSEVVSGLAGFVIESSSDFFKEASLIALEAIMRQVDPAAIAAHVPKVLEAIQFGMRSPYPELQLVATRALCATINLYHDNFRKMNEKQMAFTLIIETMVSPDPHVRLASYECLVKISDPYYTYLPEFIMQIAPLTISAINTDPSEAVVLQAIEFWTTLVEIEDGLSEHGVNKTSLYDVLSGLAKILAPSLCICVLRDIEIDLEQWSLTSAGTFCLSSLAEMFSDSILDPTLQFIAQNIEADQSQNRAASFLVFGSVINGFRTQAIRGTLLGSLIPVFDAAIGSDSLVQNTAAWVLRRIAQFHPTVFMIEPANFQRLVQCLLMLLASPDMALAAMASETILNLSCALDEPLFPFLEDLFNMLLKTLERSEGYISSLQFIALEAIRQLIRITPQHMLNFIEGLMQRCTMSLAGFATNENINYSTDMVAEICAVVGTCMTRLGSAIPYNAGPTIDLLFGFMANNCAPQILSEIFLCFSTLIPFAPQQFKPYVQRYTDVIYQVVQYPPDHQLFTCAINAISDLCIYFPETFVKDCNHFLSIILSVVSSGSCQAQLAHVAVSCLADIVRILDDQLSDQYINMLNVFITAGNDVAVLNTTRNVDKEQVKTIFLWRETVLSALSCCMLYVPKSCRQDLYQQLQAIYGIIRAIAEDTKDKNRCEEYNYYMCALILDIATTVAYFDTAEINCYGSYLEQLIHTPEVPPKIRDAAHAAKATIDKL